MCRAVLCWYLPAMAVMQFSGQLIMLFYILYENNTIQ